jgi:hypothetical protein
MLSIANEILTAAILACLAVSAQADAAYNCSIRPYSAWMADSIISRGQAIATASSSPTSVLLQIGIFQTALLSLLGSPAADCSQYDYELFLKQSTESIVGQILNASEDTQYPLDRLSVGRGLLWEYVLVTN